jgi:hypothetical protein
LSIIYIDIQNRGSDNTKKHHRSDCICVLENNNGEFSSIGYAVVVEEGATPTEIENGPKVGGRQELAAETLTPLLQKHTTKLNIISVGLSILLNCEYGFV